MTIINFKFLLVVRVCLVCLGMLCGGCKDDASSKEISEIDRNWVNDEILKQLKELKKENILIRKELVRLSEKLDGLQVTNKRIKATVPAKISLNLDKNILGRKSAGVAIIEYTDYQCPYCARHSASVLPKIKDKLVDSGKVIYQILDYPLGFHNQAKNAAVAANCAGEQGRYWEMHDALFTNQKALNNAFYFQKAKDFSLDESIFSACLSDEKNLEMVDQSIAYGNQIGVSGTPKFFIGRVEGSELTNVSVISGAQPYSAFETAVEKLLN